MTELEPLSPTAVARREPSSVHDAVRDQLLAEIGAARLDKLRAVVDDAAFTAILHWLSSARRSSPDTKHGYTEDLTRIATWACEHFGIRPVPLLQAMDFDTVTILSVWQRSQGASVRWQRRQLASLSSLFTYTARRGWSGPNPVSVEDHARPIGTSDSGRPAGATRVLSIDQAAQLRDACGTAEERLVFDLLCTQGLRESEVVKSQVENFDRNRMVLRFERKRGLWCEREIPMTTREHLVQHLAGRATGPLLLKPGTTAQRTRFQLIDMTRKWARRAGLPNPSGVTPHVLRALAITALLNSGVSIQEVQKWAGHASSDTTQGYWERSNALARDAALSGGVNAMLDKAAAGLTP